jgi:molecular chaperone DnaK
MDKIVPGIDLGTTFSLVAYVDEEGRPHVVENSEGKYLTPSVVLIEDGNIVVGELAANQAIIKQDRVIRCIKRSMWDDSFRFCGMSAVEISAEILKKLMRDAEAAIGQKLRKTVITCPAYFSSPEVENTRKAGELSGLEVTEIVREPTAAAVYYGVENLREGEKVLVYDLGGGTFDATILEYRDDRFHPLATRGERELGGHDWTTDLLTYVAQELGARLGRDPRDDPFVHQALFDRCEIAKRDLAKLDRVMIPCTMDDRTEQVAVTYNFFEELTEPRIQRTLECIHDAFAKAQPPLTWAEIDKTLLVGGSTRLRRVVKALEEASGKPPIRTAEVDTMVALGAAVLAKGTVRSHCAVAATDSGAPRRASIVTVNFDRTCPRNLGTRVIAWADKEPQIINSAIIPYGTAIPTEKTREDYTSAPCQKYFDVPIVEYDNMGQDVIVGTFRFQCLQWKLAKRQIAVTFKYDKSGIIDVDARDVQSGTILSKRKVEYIEPDLNQLKAKHKPRHLVFALDVSSSMAGEKLQHARKALVETASNLFQSAATTQIGIVTFCSSVTRICEFTEELDIIKKAVRSVQSSGSTRMDQGIELAVRMLESPDQECSQEIALVTDGMPDDKNLTIRAVDSARNQGIKISAVGIGSHDVDEEFLRSIATNSKVIDDIGDLAVVLPNLLMQRAAMQEISVTWGRNHG